jgi:hypothetical protein
VIDLSQIFLLSSARQTANPTMQQDSPIARASYSCSSGGFHRTHSPCRQVRCCALLQFPSFDPPFWQPPQPLPFALLLPPPAPSKRPLHIQGRSEIHVSEPSILQMLQLRYVLTLLVCAAASANPHSLVVALLGAYRPLAPNLTCSLTPPTLPLHHSYSQPFVARVAIHSDRLCTDCGMVSK